MLLDENIVTQLKEYFKVINRPISFRVKNIDKDTTSFLEEMLKTSDKFNIVKD